VAERRFLHGGVLYMLDTAAIDAALERIDVAHAVLDRHGIELADDQRERLVDDIVRPTRGDR
jgi:hypothetical protein